MRGSSITRNLQESPRLLRGHANEEAGGVNGAGPVENNSDKKERRKKKYSRSHGENGARDDKEEEQKTN